MNSSSDSLDEVLSIEGKSSKDLIKLGKQFQIQNFRDLAELRQKILLTILKQKKAVIDINYYNDDFIGTKEFTIKEDALRRNKISGYIDTIQSIYKEISKLDKIRTPNGIDISEKDDPLKQKIKNEFVNIGKQLKLKKEILSKSPNCALLICGDSGAGKSSFINLLIHESLLPTSIRSNTSCQVQLTFGKHERAEIVDLNGETIFIEKTDFTNTLRKYLESLDDRKNMTCKSASIFLKNPILEGGLDIYDTIGLGESQIFDNAVIKDLRDITGVIFLLKKNNPIGDDTVGGVSKVINYMAKNGIPGGSMHFIINMCDQLTNSQERDTLKSNVINQLREKCGLYPEVSTFSTKEELFLQSNQVMSRDYEHIMNLIRVLHINSINTNTISAFEYLFQFVWKTIDYIIESENFAAADQVHKKGYILKLKNLESDRKLLNQSFKKDNEKFLKDKKEKYKREVVKYFALDNTKVLVVNDVVNRHHQLFGMTSKDEIDKEIDEYTHEAILKYFKEHIEKESILKKCCEEMLLIFLQQFAEHQKKKDLINQNMNKHINSVIDNMKGGLRIKDFNDLIGSTDRRFFQIFAPILMPGIEFKNVMKREIEGVYSWILTKINMSNVHKFYENPTSYVSQKSAAYYSKFISRNRHIDMIMKCLFKAPNNVTQEFEKHLTDDMDYLAKNISLLEEDMRNKEKVIDTYKDIKQRLTVISEDFCKISLFHIQRDKYDIVRDKVEIKDDKTPILKNRNRTVFRGDFKTSQPTDSAIMIFNNNTEKSWRDLYQEYLFHKETLRVSTDKKNEEVVKCFIEIKYHIFYGINDSDVNHPMFVVNGIDYSLESYIKEFRKSNKSENYNDKFYNEVCWILKQIVYGLSYLHEQKPSLVHYDLTIDSIGYNSTYKAVKLSSISLETKVQIDYSIKTSDEIMNIVHFPANILERNSNELYSSRTDIYCLGTVLYTMWFGINPFFNTVYHEEIKSVDQFVKIIKNGKLSKLIENEFHGFSGMMFSYCTLCWENKFTAKSFHDTLGKETYYGFVNK